MRPAQRSRARYYAATARYMRLPYLANQMLNTAGYEFDCALTEPQSCRPAAAHHSASHHQGCDAQPQLPLSSAQFQHLLECSAKFLGWRSPQLIDVEELHTTSRIHLETLVDLSPRGISVLVSRTRLPVDTIALVFAALALGAVATGEPGHGRFYFGVSTEMVKYCVGELTLDLCLSYFLQHLHALRSGTSNYAQGIILQAIHVSRALGLHQNTHGNRGLLLFMLIYMADQYGSLQHNTEPHIQASNLEDFLFAPLIEAEPELQAVVELVTINGHVIEQSYRRLDLSDEELLKLETKIGSFCWQRRGPIQPGCGSYRRNYDLVAHIHMLCCRLKLRAPRLSVQSSWLLSLSTCIHAAQGVLTAYLQLYQPVLAMLAKQFRNQDLPADKLSTPSVAALAVTWRQVKRIMLSTFVVIFAYWHGELVHDEASRYMAMARLLLEYPRWRWGEALNEAVVTLYDISGLANFSIYQHLQGLLPGQSEHFLRSLCDRMPKAEPDGFDTDQPEYADDALFGAAFWPTVNAFPWSHDFPGFDISTIEDQTDFGLAESMEYHLNDVQQNSNT
ncbi:uncharacterized protein A1O9_11585 [Exophiala aquamarina CBS 119918]|uniref:Transcription factor domain-containing protein n=1 Tax=Exophiala aquamarina CBS 119918 TaxID=1182545 RepID=A0A072P9Y0_9EURO|nr:uncharacterized protein A1O9_11585 [Exophiala aquamarina CBS 119918]KEF52345.1 hypothetical protein A1O9_11585 [Exophiala aquamarina CBS 119918]